MTTLNDKIREVEDAPTEDFAELLEIAGLDTKKDLRHSNWSESDFGNADLDGWDFTGAKLDGADLSKVRNIDKAIFSAATTFDGTILPEGMAISRLLAGKGGDR